MLLARLTCQYRPGHTTPDAHELLRLEADTVDCMLLLASHWFSKSSTANQGTSTDNINDGDVKPNAAAAAPQAALPSSSIPCIPELSTTVEKGVGWHELLLS